MMRNNAEIMFLNSQLLNESIYQLKKIFLTVVEFFNTRNNETFLTAIVPQLVFCSRVFQPKQRGKVKLLQYLYILQFQEILDCQILSTVELRLVQSLQHQLHICIQLQVSLVATQVRKLIDPSGSLANICNEVDKIKNFQMINHL